MVKEDRAGGRAEREIELGEERRWERHKEDDEHMGKKNEPSNQVFIKINMLFSSYIFRFIEFKGDVTVKRRVAEVIRLLVDRFFLFVGVAWGELRRMTLTVSDFF